MGIFDFLKKSKQVEEKEVISKSQLSEWLLNRQKQHQEKEQEFLVPIKERISKLISELKDEIGVLENVDFEKKKVDSRVKLIVRENLRNYIGYLQKMIQRLEEIDERDKIVDKINFVFDDFDKKSKISYEKITFIVGKEMQATKDSIKRSLKNLKIILKMNKKEFEEFETIRLIENDVKKIKDIEEGKEKVLKVLNEDIGRLENLKKDLENDEGQIKKLKQSDKFKQEENKRKEIELKKQELEKDISELNRLIDFKALSSFYHKFENEMRIVKEYKENFKQTLKKSKIEDLANLLKESKLSNEKILELIQEIDNKENQILDTFIDDFGINNLESEIARTKSETQAIESEKLAKEKKLKSLDQDLDKVLNEVKNKLEKIGVEFD